MSLSLNDLTRFRRRNAGSEEVHALLDLLPQPALVASARTGRILFSNGAATQLTAYTRKELSELSLRTLLPELDASQRGKHPTALVKRNSQRSAVVVHISALSGTDQWLALTFEPAGSPPAGEDNRQRWEALHMLSLAAQQPELASAYRQILQAGALLTGARHLVLYTPRPQGQLHIQAVHGSGVDFPPVLEAQDLATLRLPKVWQPGRSIEAQLQRVAHTHKLAFLATTPLDLTQPEAGLLAAASQGGQPAEELLTLLQILAASATTAALNANISNTWQQDAQRLAEQEQLSALLHTYTQDGVIFVDASLRLSGLNPAAEHLLGYSQAEVLGLPVQDVLIGVTPLHSDVEAALHSQQVVALGKRSFRKRDASEFIALTRIVPIRVSGALSHLAILLSDLSETELLQAELEKLSDRAWLGERASDSAHEMKNPLNNISSTLQLLQMDLEPDDPRQEQLSATLEDCERLLGFANSMLTLGSGRGRVHQPQSLDVAEFLHKQMMRWRPRLMRKNVKDHLEIEEGLPRIQADPDSLQQVFTNLIGNALDALDGQTNGLLAIKAQRAGDTLEVLVSDNGPGIPDEQRDKIFGAFFTTKGAQGTGLGLSISRRIMLEHKGDITLESFPGGTLFKLRLPIPSEEDLQV